MHRRLSVAALAGAAAALVAVPALAAPPGAASRCSGDWPMFQHDAARSGAACATTIDPADVGSLHQSWFSATSGAVSATPAVSGTRVYVGDSTGTFYALDRSTGRHVWSFSVAANACHDDRHAPSYGEITSSAAVAPVGGGRRLVLFGGGGTLYALDAATGACAWARDLDPSHPASDMEVESSPVVAAVAGRVEVVVGSDGNEDHGTGANVPAPPGVQAFAASDGTLLWKYEPEMAPATQPVHTLSTAARTDGCGDVWTSPAVDPAALGGHGLAVFATGNCPARSRLEGIMAVDATTGRPAWQFFEPPNDYAGTAYPAGGDTDFGSSPIITTVATAHGAERVVLEGSKSGYVYAVDEVTGARVWQVQAAQPGEIGTVGPTAAGGFIGSAALGPAAGGGPAFFGASALMTPFSGQGAPHPDPSLACLDPSTGTPTVGRPACDPLRAASLHAVAAGTGKVLWQAPVSLPAFGSVTYAGGVVFAPWSTGAAEAAYSAADGTPLWVQPLGAIPASGAAVAGGGVYLGTGIDEGQPTPGRDGVWAFDLG